MADCLDIPASEQILPEDDRTRLERARIIMEMFINDGIKDYQAAAIAGVMRKESGLNPAAINKNEAAGNGTESTKDGGYGAGLLQYTGNTTKQKVMDTAHSIGITANLLEQLSLEDQIRTYRRFFKTDSNARMWYKALQRTPNLDTAVATFFCYIGRPGDKKYSDKINGDGYCSVHDALYVAGIYDRHNKSKRNTFYISHGYADLYLIKWRYIHKADEETLPRLKKKVDINNGSKTQTEYYSPNNAATIASDTVTKPLSHWVKLKQ